MSNCKSARNERGKLKTEQSKHRQKQKQNEKTITCFVGTF